MIGTILLAATLAFSLLAALSFGAAWQGQSTARYGRICFALSFLVHVALDDEPAQDDRGIFPQMP